MVEKNEQATRPSYESPWDYAPPSITRQTEGFLKAVDNGGGFFTWLSKDKDLLQNWIQVCVIATEYEEFFSSERGVYKRAPWYWRLFDIRWLRRRFDSEKFKRCTGIDAKVAEEIYEQTMKWKQIKIDLFHKICSQLDIAGLVNDLDERYKQQTDQAERKKQDE